MKIGMLSPGLLVLVLASFARADDARMMMELQAPIESWDEAIPLGNGLTGGLLWGKENTINLSLDRGDLWDERLPEIYHQDNWNYGTIRRLQAAGKQEEISRLFDAPYAMAYPTKLPGGRLVLTLKPTQKAQQFKLDMRRAIGSVDLNEGTLEVFYSATAPVAMVRCTGPAPTCKFLRPGGLNKLGYQEAKFGQSEGILWMCQEAAQGLKYAVVVASRQQAEQTELAVAIVSNRETDDPLAAGKES
ncbi:MAG: glycoside hydrolase N-terminal domain-containing protein, partial [Hyphomicrobiales bacterium]